MKLTFRAGVSIGTILVLVPAVLFFYDVPGCSASSITHKEAIAKASKEMTHLGYDLAKLDVVIDEHNTALQQLRERTKKNLTPYRAEAERRLAEYENKLHGHTYWTVGFRFKPQNGDVVLGGGLVFVDVHTGEILLVIHGH